MAVWLRHALRRDLGAIVDLWVDAFADDPYLRWIQPDDQRWPAFGNAWMRFIADLVFERGHTYVADPAEVAIAWVPPDIALVGPDDVVRGRSIIAEHAGDVRADDALATIMAARGHALEEPHWTLQYIGVRPRRQGTGLGAAAARQSCRSATRRPCPVGWFRRTRATSRSTSGSGSASTPRFGHLTAKRSCVRCTARPGSRTEAERRPARRSRRSVR